MPAQVPVQPLPSLSTGFADGHRVALRAADVLLGSFCGLMVLVAAVGWLRGATSGLGVLALIGLWIVNAGFSELSLRAEDPYRIEGLRVAAGGLLAPAAHLLVSGPLAPWWPGYLVMCLWSVVVLSLRAQRRYWGRLIVLYYVGLLALVSVVRGVDSWYQLFISACAIAMVGLMFAQILTLLVRKCQGLQARTAELRSARDALFAEIEVTHKIQTLLVPVRPVLPGMTMAGRMLPAKEVSGDYYDVLELEGRRFLAMGDVSGHGVTSGLTMMMARAGLVGILEGDPRAPLGSVYRKLNRCLRHNLGRMGVDMYMTLVLVESLGEGRFAAVGQHLPPLIYRRGTGEVEMVQLMGAWLGVVEDLPEELTPIETFQLSPGDLLVLYTDGVIERFAGKQMFGFDRLKEVVQQHGPKGPGALVHATLEGLERFSREQGDDVTMLVAGYQGDTAGTFDGWEPTVLPAERTISDSARPGGRGVLT